MNSNFTRQKRKRSRNKPHNYQNLEPRQLLAAITSFDVSTGTLSVVLPDVGDFANISVNDAGEVLVNGSRDVNSNSATIETLLASSISILNVAGSAGIANQTADFGGDFSSAAANLSDVSATDLDSVQFSGTYGMTGDLTVILEGAGGGLTDSDSSSLFVGGEATITARNNDVVLDGNVNLQGSLRVSTLGGHDVSISVTNRLELANVSVTGDLFLSADGAVTDVDGAFVLVDGDATFNAISVTLGDNADDRTNFHRTHFDVVGLVELHEDSNIVFGSSTMGSLIAESSGGIYDGRETRVLVNDNAALTANFGVRLGEHGLDTFNAGSLTLNTVGHVHIFEDSGTHFVGSSTANTMDITSLGDVTNAAGASIATNFATGFEGDNIFIGNAVGDSILLGGVYFWSLGDVEINEDANLFLIDGKNRADRLTLRSSGNIADGQDAFVTVERLTSFDAVNVTMGDSLEDRFNSGSIMFAVTDSFYLREDSGVNVVGTNLAGQANVGAAGNVTNAAEASISIADVARFLGDNINIGNQESDQANFGSVVFTTSGDALISEDSSTILAGVNSADRLVVRSSGSITNADESRVNILRTANFQAVNGINVGNSLDDEFNAISVTANTTIGNVLLNEDSSMFIVGENNAFAMVLSSAGSIGNAHGAVIDVADRLTLNSGDFISLGTKVDSESGEDTDRIESALLNVNAIANATIESQSDVLFVGSSAAFNLNVVARDGEADKSIGDQPEASIAVAQSIFLTGLDVIIGELDTDCLEVGQDVNVLSSGSSDVQTGCPA